MSDPQDDKTAQPRQFYANTAPMAHDRRCPAHPQAWPPGQQCICGASKHNYNLRRLIFTNECCARCANKTIARLWPNGFRP